MTKCALFLSLFASKMISEHYNYFLVRLVNASAERNRDATTIRRVWARYYATRRVEGDQCWHKKTTKEVRSEWRPARSSGPRTSVVRSPGTSTHLITSRKARTARHNIAVLKATIMDVVSKGDLVRVCNGLRRRVQA